MLKAYFYKLFRSPLLYIGIAGVAALCCMRLNLDKFRGIDVIQEMELIRGLDGYRKLFALLAALPFASNFSDEWNCMVTTGCISRTSVRKYSVTNVFMCYASALSVVFIGMMIFAVVYSMFYPMFVPGGGSDLGAYGILTSWGLPLLDIAAATFVFAASCAMWSVMGLMLTAFFPSKFIAICAPFIFSYVVERITMNFPDQLNLWPISLSHSDWSALPTFLYANAMFAGISVICGIVFTLTVKRRVQNGIN